MSITKEIFSRRKRIGTYWLNKSSDLHAAAAALWYSVDAEVSDPIVARFGLGSGFAMAAAVPDVFRMLCGMSLELLLKAILVSKRLDVPHKHDLVALAESAAVPLDDRDRGLYAILTECVRWDGRYPVSKTLDEFEDLAELEERLLTDVIGTSGRLVFRQGNDALSWDGFDRLWKQAAVHYVPSTE